MSGRGDGPTSLVAGVLLRTGLEQLLEERVRFGSRVGPGKEWKTTLFAGSTMKSCIFFLYEVGVVAAAVWADDCSRFRERHRLAVRDREVAHVSSSRLVPRLIPPSAKIRAARPHQPVRLTVQRMIQNVSHEHLLHPQSLHCDSGT